MKANVEVKSSGEKIPVSHFLIKYNTIIIFVALIIVSSFLSDSFFTKQNVFNVLRQQSPYLCVSLGMLIVLLTGGIDLSAGSVAGVAGMILAMALSRWGFTSMPGLLVAMIMVLAIGCLNGFIMGALISYLKLAPFIISLAFMTIGRGIAYMLTYGQPVRLDKTLTSNKFWVDFGSKYEPLIGIPWPVLLVIALIIIFHLLMKYTRFGRLIIAIGSNEEAVRLSGINVNKYKIPAYMICSTMAALAGTLVTARAALGTAITGDGYELDAIAGCVIGGASLSGGKGSVIMTVIGMLTLGLIGNIMNLMSIAAYPQRVIKGIIIVVAVIMQTITNKEKAG
jgi:ribose transport system permease protein